MIPCAARRVSFGALGLVVACGPAVGPPLGVGPAPAPPVAARLVEPPSPGKNLALGRSYRLEPAPSYPGCTEGGDATQLTDGERAAGFGRLWMRSGAVGWPSGTPTITIDLGATQAIGGATYSTAVGLGGVVPPVAVLLLVSDDGQAFRPAADLVVASPREARVLPATYAERRFAVTGLHARGRFARFVVLPGGPFTVVDEVEVLEGPPAARGVEEAAPVVDDMPGFLDAARVSAAVHRRLDDDLTAVRGDLARPPALDVAVAAELDARLDAIAASLPATPTGLDPARGTAFPINAAHRAIFATQAAAWRARGLRALSAWPAERWANLEPTSRPVPGDPRVDIVAARREYRSGAVNLANAGESDAAVSVAFEGLPGGPAPSYLEVHEVAITDTASGVPVATALPLAPRATDGFRVGVPAGLTRQIWLTFRPMDLPVGVHDGRLVASFGADRVVVPVRLEVSPFEFPARPTLHLGGWDYTDTEHAYDVTPENRDALVALLREHFVDTPWATSAVLPRGAYAPDGRLLGPPDTAPLRAWLDRWPDARHYLVYLAASSTFASFSVGTPEFRRALAGWGAFFARQLAGFGVAAERFGLLLVDEPSTPSDDRLVVEYARVLRAAAPGVVVWENPAHRDPRAADPLLFEAADVLSPNTQTWLSAGPAFADFYRERQRAKKRLWLYACSGSPKLLDPSAYYRAQAWLAFQLGAEGSQFWSFSDAGGGSSWNEHLTRAGGYTPLFLDRTSVTTSKQMEAIREGVEDFELLRLLRERTARLERSGRRSLAVHAARALLDAAPARVTAGLGPAAYSFMAPGPRDTVDRARLEVLAALRALPPD